MADDHAYVLQIGIEDFRVMTESFGMQLDDDSLLALFSRVMTQPSAILTCCKGCRSFVHCMCKHKVQKHATWCIQHLYFSWHCLVLQQLTATHATAGPVRYCSQATVGQASLVSLIALWHSTLRNVCSSNPQTTAVIDYQTHFAIHTCTP